MRGSYRLPRFYAIFIIFAMIDTTLCYIEKDEKYLMLHRTKKKNDISYEKWLGVGGKFEEGETPEICLLREVKEETGLTLTDYSYRGIVYFLSDIYEDERMHLFSAKGFEGELTECNEGELVWVDKDKVYDLNIWEGDKEIFKALEKRKDFFELTVRYKGDTLVDVEYKRN